MADRELLYKVSLQTSQALQQAQALKRAFEGQLKTVQITPDMRAAATATIEQERRITATTKAEAQARIAAARAEANIRTQHARATAEAAIQQERRITAQMQAQTRGRQAGSSPFGNIGGLLAGGIAGYGIAQIGSIALEQGKLGAENARLADSFRDLAATVNLSADSLTNRLRAATQGTVTDMRLMASTNLLLASAQGQGIEVTEKQIGILAQFARLRSTQLPDLTTEDAYARLITGITKRETELLDELGLSTKGIAQQLGVDVSEVNSSVEGLLDGVIKVAQIEIEKFGDPVLDEATKIEQSMTSISNSFEKLRGSLAQPLAVVLKIIADVTEEGIGVPKDLNQLRKTFTGNLDLGESRDVIDQLVNPTRIGPQIEAATRGAIGKELNTEQLTLARDVIDQFDAAVSAGAPNLQKYEAGLLEIAQAAARGNELTPKQIGFLYELDLATQQAAAGYKDLTNAQKEQAAAAAAQREGQGLIDTFRQLDSLIAEAGEFSPNVVPGIEEISAALVQLKVDIAASGGPTEKQSEQLAQMEGVLNAASAAVQFLATAEGQAAIASGGLNAALATVPGYLDAIALAAGIAGAELQNAMLIEGRARASLTSGIAGLISRGRITVAQAQDLYNQQQVGITRGAAGAAGADSPEARAFAEAELQRQTNAQVNAIEENARAAEAAQKKAASSAESAFKKAAQATERAWEDAAGKLQKSLESTPGLFGSSQVTEEQMKLAEGGIGQNFADNYLRRLEAEINEEKDLFPDVSLEGARDALNRVGIAAGDTVEATMIQLRQAWESSALFAHPGNLALINTAAVQENLALQEKAEQGRKNVYQFFANTIDSALKPFLPGGEGLAKPEGGLPEGYSVDADGNITAPRGAWAGIDQDKLDQIQELPNKIIDQALVQVDEALAGGGITGLGGTGGLTGGLAAGTEGAPGITGLTGTITLLTVDPAAAESLLSNLRSSIASDENIAILDGIGQGMSQFVGIGIAQYDFVPTATTMIDNFRAGIGSEDNLERLMNAGRDMLDTMRDGMTARSDETGYWDAAVSGLLAALLQAMTQGVAE